MNKFIEYYGKYNISPVKQNLQNMHEHLAKREKLYRQLGITRATFEGSSLLEIGPGSGYNTLAFLEGGCSHCTLVEPNSTGVRDMQQLFSQYGIEEERYHIIQDTIENTCFTQKFDIVIAEGFLHSIDNSKEIIASICKLVKPGGVVVITCMDLTSMFVEQMKRLIAHVLLKETNDYETRVRLCVDFFAPQMKALHGMSRSVEDWVRDDILNPAFQNDHYLSMGDALDAFEEDFYFLGSSQRIFTDYSWYKDLAYHERRYLKEEYLLKRHNFLLTGLGETIIKKDDSEKIYEMLKKIRTLSKRYEECYKDSDLYEIIRLLEDLAKLLQTIHETYGEFVTDTIEILGAMLLGKEVNFEDYSAFYRAVGRTQQYLSMVKSSYSGLQ
ncbi:MAG: class I SAM-dependent methyltransferase [Roseburia sp.]